MWFIVEFDIDASEFANTNRTFNTLLFFLLKSNNLLLFWILLFFFVLLLVQCTVWLRSVPFSSVYWLETSHICYESHVIHPPFVLYETC